MLFDNNPYFDRYLAKSDKFKGKLRFLDEGMFYSWGEDNENTGVLGLGAINSQTFPTTPMAFMDKRLKFIHCGEKHAAAIDSTKFLCDFYK